MPTMFKEVQDSEDLDRAQEEVSPSLDSQPDVMIAHGSTRVSLDLSAWEWLILAAVAIVAIIWMNV